MIYYEINRKDDEQFYQKLRSCILFCGTDYIIERLNYIYVDGNKIISCDGKRIIVIENKYKFEDGFYKYSRKGCYQLTLLEKKFAGKYANYRNVIDKEIEIYDKETNVSFHPNTIMNFIKLLISKFDLLVNYNYIADVPNFDYNICLLKNEYGKALVLINNAEKIYIRIMEIIVEEDMSLEKSRLVNFDLDEMFCTDGEKL